MREITKRKCICSFGVRCETAKCHGYSNEVETQTLREVKKLESTMTTATTNKRSFSWSNYSCRKATIGSRCIARRAAKKLPTNATHITPPKPITSVNGSL